MLDWVIVLIVLLSVLQAMGQGFFYEFFSLAGWLWDIYIAVPAGIRVAAT